MFGPSQSNTLLSKNPETRCLLPGFMFVMDTFFFGGGGGGRRGQGLGWVGPTEDVYP